MHSCPSGHIPHSGTSRTPCAADHPARSPGVDYIDFELEWGYRLVPECRGRGYATEASQALLAEAHQTYAGEVLAVIAPENLASQNVCRKLGFTFWKQAPVDGDLRNLYTLSTIRAG